MDGSSTPLADYFWIAGIENIAYDDAFAPPALNGANTTSQQLQQQPQPVDDTIAEDGEGEDADTSSARSPPANVRHSRHSSGNRFSKLSLTLTGDGRFLDDLDGSTQSNRSSATIRPAPSPNGTTTFNVGSALNPEAAAFLQKDMGSLSDFDFDKALFKFAAERENFLDDLSFSAGAKLQSRPPMVNPRTERLKAEDGELTGRKSPLRSIRGSIKGSIRRKISFRDMNSVRKQPATPRSGQFFPQHAKASPTPYSLGPDGPLLWSIPAHHFSLTTSFGPNVETPEQVQFGHPAAGTLKYRPRYAPPQETVRTSITRQVPG